ncbi:hypothetical protein [Micromonospora carbonacea]|uniref:Uncharacterized protein n=1 Tax=Micromonospora carbonacea TaxID=47853 RepID=A0A1C4YCC5_9ACTN|nr:hypothetical protein [Micromonospora carbonacea]SCF18422.1 hypothetical protein GA0070563_1064 [Micromonospora carbonacea]
MCSIYSPQEDTQEIRRRSEEEDEVRAILKRRQKETGHRGYGITAAVLGVLALCTWIFIFADARRAFGEPITQGYAAFLAFSGVLGIAASAATFTWAIVRDERRRTAEADRIREYHEARHVRAIRDAIGVFLREGDAAALAALERTQGYLNGTDGQGVVRQFRGRG